MPNTPVIDESDVAILIPHAENIRHVGTGGQKIVYRATLNGIEYAFKFLLLPESEFEEGQDLESSSVFLRAKREVETMGRCASPYMVKLGTTPLSHAVHKGQRLIYFSEELIEGNDLSELYRNSKILSPQETAKLGRQVGHAVKSLWDDRKVHRDIKPGNIMRRSGSGDFVLLDAGLVFDIGGESLSAAPVGTTYYFSPEQFDFSSRRSRLDFRSDFFSLGVTMYFVSTGSHPFYSRGDTETQVCTKILQLNPVRPRQLNSMIPEQLDDVIMRLLGKQPHLRYRTCDLFIEALKGIKIQWQFTLNMVMGNRTRFKLQFPRRASMASFSLRETRSRII